MEKCQNFEWSLSKVPSKCHFSKDVSKSKIFDSKFIFSGQKMLNFVKNVRKLKELRFNNFQFFDET